jgi:hypothetical protein
MHLRKKSNMTPAHNGLTVAQLIEFLRAQPQDLLVAFRIYSEQCILEVRDIEIIDACEPRADGWVQDKRPDMPSRAYLVFPGN